MNNPWISCDGDGGLHTPPKSGVSRRNLFMAAGAGVFGWVTRGSALATGTVDTRGHANHTLVVIFLRGGWDGLNVLIPHFDDDYGRARPNLQLRERGTLQLDGKFGLHPALASLHPYWEAGHLAGVHAVGSLDQTRSHFEAMSAMERGLGADGPGPADGWLARHLASTAQATDSPLRAVSMSATLPDSLRGATSATALSGLDSYQLRAPSGEAQWFDAIDEMYAAHADVLGRAGTETIRAVRQVREIANESAKPQNGAVYPETGLGVGLADTARLIRSGVGLEIACLDMGGWDTHVAQGVGSGWMPTLLDEVGRGTAAFARDLGPLMRRTTVVIMSEFGRRVAENAGMGTDHGRGGVMLVVGDTVRGGEIYTKWPGLGADALDGPGDLRVTTDYRGILSEIVAKRLGNPHLEQVFPGFSGSALNVMV